MRRRRAVTTLLIALLGLVAGVLLAGQARAEIVRSLSVQVTVKADSSMNIVETIVYDFAFTPRHGIYRDIPQSDELTSGQRRDYGIVISSVTQDGEPATYELIGEGRNLQVKIGDPDSTVTGAHTYVIDYTVSNGLRSISAEDVQDPQMPSVIKQGDVELYWDLIGDAWGVRILSARGSITGPADVVAAACYSGAFGSTRTCPVDVNGPTASVGGIELDVNQGMTAAVVWPGGAFTKTPTEDYHQGLPTTPEFYVSVGGLLGLLLLVVPPLGALILRRRDRGVRRDSDPAQYAPPDGVTAAEMVAAWRGPEAENDSRPLVATLVDLAARGWVTLTPDDELVVTKTVGGVDELQPWERDFLDRMVPGNGPTVLRKHDPTHARAWRTTYRHLVAEARKSGRRSPRGDRPDRRWRWLEWVGVSSLVLGIIALLLGKGFLSWGLVPLGVGAWVGGRLARAISPRTETRKSAEFNARVRGFRHVLDGDNAAARREFAQRLGLPAAAVMSTMLPFAIVFDLEKSWMNAFPELTPEDISETGFGPTTMNHIGRTVHTASSLTPSATMSALSGLGGGGSSGGGGGGGGGGSW